jgi:hypothetical protein
MRLGRLVELRQISGGCPEQWEGKTSAGEYVYARERHGEVLIEVDGSVVFRGPGDWCYEELAKLFDLPDTVDEVK